MAIESPFPKIAAEDGSIDGYAPHYRPITKDRDFTSYVSYVPGSHGVNLNGFFDVEELRALVAHIDAHKDPARAYGGFLVDDVVHVFDQRDGQIVDRNATITKLEEHDLPNIGRRMMASLSTGYAVTTAFLVRSGD